MASQNISPHVENKELGQQFRQAREARKLSQNAAAAKHLGYSPSTNDSFELSEITNAVLRLRSIESGDFFVDSKHQQEQQRFIHSLAEIYDAQVLEDSYCRELCPIGRSRKQLEYDNIKEVTLSLSASLDHLEDNAQFLSRRIRDNRITQKEWSDILPLLSMLNDISARAKSIQRWSGFIPETVLDDGHEETQKPTGAIYQESRNEVQTVKNDGSVKAMTQKEAAEKIGIPRTTLADIESLNSEHIPTQNQVIRMSKAYLSPKIRNFYCYHDCPIGGRQDPLNVCDSKDVTCMFLSSLFYIGDLNRQLRRMLADGAVQEHEKEAFQHTLNELMDFSRQADTMRLSLMEQLCAQLRGILADGRVDEAEEADFRKNLDILEKLGYPQEDLDELKEEYLNGGTANG